MCTMFDRTQSSENCPSCGKSWKSSKIPKHQEHCYESVPRDENGDRWYSCLVGIYSMEKDRTTHYQCPFCDWTSNGSPPEPLNERLRETYSG